MKRNDRLRNLMQTAWRLARQGARRYGGKAREYIAVALKMAWKALRKATWFVGEGNTWFRLISRVRAAAWMRLPMSFAVNAIVIIGRLSGMIVKRTDAAFERKMPIASFSTLKRNWRSGLSRSRLGFRPSG